MRVICVIPFDPHQIDPICRNWRRPEVGDMDEVTDSEEMYGHLYYTLAGYPVNMGFDSTHFATLPEATADEMAEAEREAILM